jgi:hypothetical protein
MHRQAVSALKSNIAGAPLPNVGLAHSRQGAAPNTKTGWNNLLGGLQSWQHKVATKGNAVATWQALFQPFIVNARYNLATGLGPITLHSSLEGCCQATVLSRRNTNQSDLTTCRTQ